MKITYLGHSCYLVSCSNKSFLIDPLLTEQFQHGIAQVHPTRKLDIKKMPKIDAVFISHFHQGHLEVESLDKINRSTPIFYSKDEITRFVLEKMNFTNIIPIVSSQIVSIGNVKIEITPTGAEFSLVGFIFNSEEGNFWYMGDRGDTIVNNDLFSILNKYNNGIDFLVPSHPSDENQYLFSSSLGSGANEKESQNKWLSRSIEVITHVKPRLFCPNTVGMKYVTEETQWLNRFLFPMTGKDFIKYVNSVNNKLLGGNLYSGDVVYIKKNKTFISRQEAEFVSTVDENCTIRFDPNYGVPILKDPNLINKDIQSLRKMIKKIFEKDFYRWLEDNLKKKGSICNVLQKEDSTYYIIVVYPSKNEDYWEISFEVNKVKISQIKEEEMSSNPYFATRIPATIILKWYLAEIPYYYAWNFVRSFHTGYSVVEFQSGKIFSKPKIYRDLLTLYFNSNIKKFLFPYYEKTINNLQMLS